MNPDSVDQHGASMMDSESVHQHGVEFDNNETNEVFSKTSLDLKDNLRFQEQNADIKHKCEISCKSKHSREK